ncbi:MAG: hypothetical protein NUW00_00440 [Candidatus Kaiserbacteria bacterium]|nr:hypothetical protein [Candidatus Kaiserbacteria bacterium]
MKNSHKGFISPLLLALVTILLIGGGAYVYVQNKQASQSAVISPSVQSTSTTAGISDWQKSKWVGTSYCGNSPPSGTETIGSYSRLHLVMTKDGEELWALDTLDQSKEFLNHTKDCPQIYTVKDALSFPPVGGGLTLAIDNCDSAISANATPGSQVIESHIVDLVDETEYLNQDLNTTIQPVRAWRIQFPNPRFEEISVTNLVCYPNQPDPY